MSDELKRDALEYHRFHPPGKLEVNATKPLANQRDLALAYSPGVAAACEAIQADPGEVNTVTARANLVGVITNGTAVLGLGDIGPLASKPVMEGKAVLFKKFAGIDVFDIEINERDPDRLVDIIASLEPTFAGFNLEDIKSPECFQIEGKLKRRVKVPVFHDDQHGTAIIVGAAILNALYLVGKRLDEVRLVTSGAGAAAIACLKLLVVMGMPAANITVTDIDGVVYRGRKASMDPHKRRFAQDTEVRTLGEAIAGADVFLGLSAGNVLKPEMLETMAARPIILALANPTPEIDPRLARQVRPDALIATGRSDYPNQVNNVLCFPYIFRGTLDVGATEINDQMKIACVHALAELVRSDSPDAAAAYSGDMPSFGPEHLIPTPFDPRLLMQLAPAVARAAMESGVATRPITDFTAYRDKLERHVFHSVLIMKPLFDRAKKAPRRLLYTDGEEATVLRAVQSVLDEGIARPVLLGDLQVIAAQIRALGLRIRPQIDFEVMPVDKDAHRTQMAARLVNEGRADGLLCGMSGRFVEHRDHILGEIGLLEDTHTAAAMQVLVLKRGIFFICDTSVNLKPNPEQLADITLLAAEAIRRFTITPRAALLSHSSFGSSKAQTAQKMRDALVLIQERDPDLLIEGEMQADAALIESIRRRVRGDTKIEGYANLLIMPSVDAANIAMNLLKVLGDGSSVGPILLGVRKAAHILAPSASVRGIVNMSALAVVDAQREAAGDS